MGTHVFISYAHADGHASALKLEAALRQAQIPCFRDQTIGLDEVSSELLVAIREASVMVLLLTPRAANSPWVQQEVACAVMERTELVVVQLEPTELPDRLNFFLAGFRRLTVDARTASWNEVAEQLRAHFDRDPRNIIQAKQEAYAKIQQQIAIAHAALLQEDATRIAGSQGPIGNTQPLWETIMEAERRRKRALDQAAALLTGYEHGRWPVPRAERLAVSEDIAKLRDWDSMQGNASDLHLATQTQSA